MAYSVGHDSTPPADLSMAWHAHAPPPPPGSPSTSKQQRRHSYNPPTVGQYVTTQEGNLTSPEQFAPPPRSRTPLGGHRAAASISGASPSPGTWQQQQQQFQQPLNGYPQQQQQHYSTPAHPSQPHYQYQQQQHYAPQQQPVYAPPVWNAASPYPVQQQQPPQAYAAPLPALTAHPGYAHSPPGPQQYAAQTAPNGYYAPAAHSPAPLPPPIQTQAQHFVPPSVAAASPISPLVYRPQVSPLNNAAPVVAAGSSGRPLPSPGATSPVVPSPHSQVPPSSSAAWQHPTAGSGASPLTANGSVRRNLPQPPGAPANAPSPQPPVRSQTLREFPAASSAASGAGAGAASSSNSSVASAGLTRAQTVRNAAEALMAMGPPARRRARADIPSWSSSGDVSSKVGASSKESESAVPHSQSAPGRVAKTSEEEAAAAHSFADLNLERSDSGKASEHGESSIRASSRPVSPSPRLASQAPDIMAPPERPKSRGPRDDEVRSSVERRRSVVAAQQAPQLANGWSSQQAPVATVRPQGRALPQVQVHQQHPHQHHQSQQPQQSYRAPPAAPRSPQTAPRTPPAAPSVIVASAPPSISVAPVTPPPPTIKAPDIAVSSPQINVAGPNGGGPSIAISSADGNDDDDSGGPVIAVSGPDDDSTPQPPPTISMSHTGAPASPQRASSGMARGGPLPEKGPASASSVGSGASCAGCGKWTGGRVLQAMGTRTWHPACFSCAHCSTPLEHVAFYEHEGRPYCHFDYHELFSTRCFHCRTPIVDERFIQIDDPQLGKRAYHELHFFCANCGDPFLDPKAAGSAAGAMPDMHLEQDEEGRVVAGGKAFVVHKAYPYCESCHINLHYPRCKGCRKPIASSDILSALGAKWHPGCLVCEACKRPFEGEQMFVRGNKAWDEDCYKVLLRNEL